MYNKIQNKKRMFTCESTVIASTRQPLVKVCPLCLSPTT